MSEEVATSRSARNRRTMAILAWTGMTAVAILLWVCRRNGTISGNATEPIALMLSAYAAFVSIFSWMLFAPGRRALKESPALFFSAAFTLLPPCIIAFHLMPPESALRGWLTLGMFGFGAIAILSPVPEEFFAIPRERQSYLRPVTGTLFEGVQSRDFPRSLPDFPVEPIPQLRAAALPEPSVAVFRGVDPWLDPFTGTGISPSRRRPEPAKTPPPTAPTRPTAPTPDRVSSAPVAGLLEAALQSDRSRLLPTAEQSAGDAVTSRPSDPEISFDRVQDEYGGELVEGTIRVRFEPGQKRAQLHVPFSPPLAGVPDVECEPVGGEALRVRVPVRQTYGIRIEARRSDASEPLESEVGFSAIYTPPERRI